MFCIMVRICRTGPWWWPTKYYLNRPTSSREQKWEKQRYISSDMFICMGLHKYYANSLERWFILRHVMTILIKSYVENTRYHPVYGVPDNYLSLLPTWLDGILRHSQIISLLQGSIFTLPFFLSIEFEEVGVVVSLFKVALPVCVYRSPIDPLDLLQGCLP